MSMPNPWDGSGRGEWRTVLVYGLGASGRSASRLLLALGAEVVAVDARPADALDFGDFTGWAGRDGLRVLAGEEPDALPPGVDAVVVSPGVPLNRPLLAEAGERGVPVLAEVELAFPYLTGPVVAVTGSNGKSTTTALAGAMLREAGFDAAVCGNFGPPLSAQVDLEAAVRQRAATAGGHGEGAGKVFVVEMSSFQLAAIRTFRPRAAALLNVAADHLDRHGGLEAYTAAKRRIFENQSAEDVAVLNADDPLSRETVVAARGRLFSRLGPVDDGCYLDGERVIERGGGGAAVELFRADDSPLQGAHNLANAMAAALLARALGAPPEACRAGLSGFRGFPHRMERVLESGGVVWYDDSKGTNPAAVLGCLEGFPDGSVHLILGGRGKGTDFAVLASAARAKAVHVYLIGETAGELENALAGAAPVVRAGTLDRAVAEAALRARPGESVLLSPACASFDQFRDFNQRGEAFQRLVHAIVGGGGSGQEAGL